MAIKTHERLTNNNTTLSKSIKDDFFKINLSISNGLQIFGIFETNILKIIASYDERLKFSVIRAKVRGIKARIESGNETPIMRKILRTIVRSKERYIEDTQEIQTNTPPTSSSEDESDSETENFSTISHNPRSSIGGRARTLPEHSVFLFKPRSSIGGRVRTLKEQTFFCSKPRSSIGGRVRTLKEQTLFSSNPRSSIGGRVRTLKEQSFFSTKPRSSIGGRVRTLKEHRTSTPCSSSSEEDTDSENTLITKVYLKPQCLTRGDIYTVEEHSFSSFKPPSSNERQEQSFASSSKTGDDSDSEKKRSLNEHSESLILIKPTTAGENTHGAIFAQPKTDLKPSGHTNHTTQTMVNYPELKDSENNTAPNISSTKNERYLEMTFSPKGHTVQTQFEPKSSIQPVLCCDIIMKQSGNCSMSQLSAKDSDESVAEVPVVGSGDNRRKARALYDFLNKETEPLMLQNECSEMTTSSERNSGHKQISESIPFGLVNLGNTCYMNATIQSLHACEKFKGTLFSSTKEGLNDNLSKEIARVFTNQLTSVYRPIKLLKTICSNKPFEKYANGEQQDCCELMVKLMDYWSKANKEILKLFEGGVRSEITCSKCNTPSHTWDCFMILKLCFEDKHLCKKGTVSVEDLISNWRKKEILDEENGYRCINCNETTKSVKTLEISNAPSILVVQIKRFEYTNEGKGRKLCKLIKFTDKLNINVDTLHEGANLISYNLKAVISHVGDEISGGHYIATTRLDASSDIWHTYSDSNCKAVSLEQVQKQQAYLLFYEKDNTTVREQIGDSVSLNTLPLSDIHYDLTEKQISKVCLLEVQPSNSKMLGGIGSKKDPRKKNDSDNKRKTARNQHKSEDESSDASENHSTETLPPAQLTTNVQRPRKRRLRKKVSRVEQNRDNQQHSTIPNTTTNTAEQTSKKRKRRKADTKPKLKKKRKPVKKKKSKGKNKAGRDYKRENELRRMRRLKKKRNREEETEKRKEQEYKKEYEKRDAKGREEETKKRKDAEYKKEYEKREAKGREEEYKKLKDAEYKKQYEKRDAKGRIREEEYKKRKVAGYKKEYEKRDAKGRIEETKKQQDAGYIKQNEKRDAKRRRLKEQAEQELADYATYNPWVHDKVPTDKVIMKHSTNPNIALATFRLMLGIPGDRRLQQDLNFEYDAERILNTFIAEAGHNTPIQLCGICGILDIIPVLHKLEFKHRKIAFQEVDFDLLANLSENKKDAMHLYTHEEKTYHLHEDAVNKDNNTVNVCDSCFTCLDYAVKMSQKPPKQTFKAYDVGRIPDDLPHLTLIEILSISRALCYNIVFHLRAMSSGIAQKALRGHSICLPLSTDDGMKTDVTTLPRDDLDKHIAVSFMGTKSVFPIARAVAKSHAPLRVRIDNVIRWLRFLKHIDNPYYRDVKIPTTNQEIKAAQIKLDNQLETILNQASVSDSGMVSRIAAEVRRQQQFRDAGGEEIKQPEGVITESIMLTKVPVHESVEQDAIEALAEAVLGQNIIEQEMIEENVQESVINEELEQISDNDANDKIVDDTTSVPEKLNIQIHRTLLNEYIDNPEILSKSFPTLFPHGLTAEQLGGTGPMSEIQRKTLLLFYDRRFATNHNFIFHHFNQEMRRQTNKEVSIRVKRGDTRTDELMEIVNQEGFLNDLKTAVLDPKSEEASSIKKNILPLVKILGSKVKWSPMERKSTLSRHYGLYHAFGLPFIFGTISPGMRDLPLALRMCKRLPAKLNQGENLIPIPEVLLTNIHERDKSISLNPVAAARVFDLVIKAFFSIIMGIPIHLLRGKKSIFTRILATPSTDFIGAYGKIRAIYGVIEAQGSGGLHIHFHAWGILDHNRMSRFIHDKQFRMEVTNFIDKIVTCQFPADIDEIDPKQKRPIISAQSYPNVANISKDSAKCRQVLQAHRHSATCWKRKDCETCRMAYKRQRAQLTYLTELYAEMDKNGKWIPTRKHEGSKPGNEIISLPPPIPENSPVDPPENRIIGFGMARKTEVEQNQVEANELTTSLLRCNTSMQPLISPSQAKSASYYAANYVSKDPFELSACLAFLYQAQLDLRKYGSKAEDAGEPSRNVKTLVEKVLHKVNKIEVSAQQAASAMLGYESYFSSHDFTYCFAWDAVKRLHEFELLKNNLVQNNQNTEDESSSSSESSDTNEEQSDSEEESQNRDRKKIKTFKNAGKLERNKDGEIITINQFSKYINKGPDFDGYSLYDYSAIVRHTNKVTKQRKLKSNRMSKAGRNVSKIYPYIESKMTGSLDSTFGQTIAQKLCIPIIPGHSPPQYPGPKPLPPTFSTQNMNTEEIEFAQQSHLDELSLWNKKAQIFVEFFSLLLLPWDERFDPRDPTNPNIQILPWNETTSWDNFTTIFRSWDVDTENTDDNRGWFRRSTYKIFSNMTTNLQQSSGARKIMLAWRALAADKRTEYKEDEPSKMGESEKKKQVNDKSTEKGDDVQLLMDLMRGRHGHIEHSKREKQATREQYLAEQTSKLGDIFQVEEIGKSNTTKIYSKEVLKACEKPYEILTKEECKKRFKKLKNGEITITVDKNNNQDKDDEREEDRDNDDRVTKISTESNTDEKKLYPEQRAVIDKMTDALRNGEQLMAMLHGAAGSGKTTIAKQFTKELNLDPIYSASTGSAAAQLKAVTINSLLHLGLSKDFVNLADETTTADAKADILRKFEGKNVLILDEVSMITPVTIARIDNRLRQCFNCHKAFGGIHVIFIGDFWQFKPVSYLKKPALYQGMVLQARNRRLPIGEAYKVGVNLFSKFQLFNLEGQRRANKEYENQFLNALRDAKKKTPITDAWVRKLQPITKEDIKIDEKWRFTTIATTGNVERRNIIQFQAQRFGEVNNEPILNWTCKVKKTKVGKSNVYTEVDFTEFRDAEQYTLLNRYFVRGAECVISENICTKLKLAKGTKGVYTGIVWDEKEHVPDISSLPKGKITVVPQPIYILITVGDTIVPIGLRNEHIDVRGEKRQINYQDNACDLLFACTYHKLQGLTLDKIILSLGKHPTVKLRVEMPSLYVGVSRVHNFTELRVLPIKNDDKEYLKTLKRDPLLNEWISNYTKEGIWKAKGFLETEKELLQNKKMNLALVDDVDSLTKDEAFKFLKDLDIIYPPTGNAKELKNLLLPAWQEGRKLLEADKSLLLNKFRVRELQNLHKLLNKMFIPLRNLRIIARKVGIMNTSKLNREKVFTQLDLVAKRYHPKTFKKTLFNQSIMKKQKKMVKRTYKFKGLVNTGNTCYFNSVMHCIHNCTELTHAILSIPNPVPGGETIRALQNYFLVMSHPSTNTNFRPKRLLDAVMNIPACRVVHLGVGSRQEDASELLTLLFSYLHETLPQTSQIYTMTYVSLLQCLNCDYTNTRRNIKFQFSVHIPDTLQHGGDQSHDLTTLIQKFKTIEILNDYRCTMCNLVNPTRKTLLLDNLPPLLVVQLVRFRGGEKIHDHVNFNQTLSTEDVSLPGQAQHMFTLFGVIVHFGDTLRSGHYKAYIKTQSSWREFDDHLVNVVSWNFVKRLHAYVLFYKKL